MTTLVREMRADLDLVDLVKLERFERWNPGTFARLSRNSGHLRHRIHVCRAADPLPPSMAVDRHGRPRHGSMFLHPDADPVAVSEHGSVLYRCPYCGGEWWQED